jgi:hypothetical protein
MTLFRSTAAFLQQHMLPGLTLVALAGLTACSTPPPAPVSTDTPTAAPAAEPAAPAPVVAAAPPAPPPPAPAGPAADPALRRGRAQRRHQPAREGATRRRRAGRPLRRRHRPADRRHDRAAVGGHQGHGRAHRQADPRVLPRQVRGAAVQHQRRAEGSAAAGRHLHRRQRRAQDRGPARGLPHLPGTGRPEDRQAGQQGAGLRQARRRGHRTAAGLPRCAGLVRRRRHQRLHPHLPGHACRRFDQSDVCQPHRHLGHHRRSCGRLFRRQVHQRAEALPGGGQEPGRRPVAHLHRPVPHQLAPGPADRCRQGLRADRRPGAGEQEARREVPLQAEHRHAVVRPQGRAAGPLRDVAARDRRSRRDTQGHLPGRRRPHQRHRLGAGQREALAAARRSHRQGDRARRAGARQEGHSERRRLEA